MSRDVDIWRQQPLANSCHCFVLLQILHFRVRTVSMNFRRLDLDRVTRSITTVIDKRTRVRPEPWIRPSAIASPKVNLPHGDARALLSMIPARMVGGLLIGTFISTKEPSARAVPQTFITSSPLPTLFRYT